MSSVPPDDFSCSAAGTPRPVGDPTVETRAEPMVAARPSGRARTLIGVGAPPPAAPDAAPLGRAPRAGDHLGPYQLCVELARGGMATLFLARVDGRAGLHRYVALKCIRPELAEDERFVQMFTDEARIATRMHHGNICNVLDFDCRRGVHYIAMEFLRGQNLGAVRRGLDAIEGTSAAPDPLRRAGLVARIMADAAEGLHAAHESRDGKGARLDVVHRDVSPENIFVTYDGTVKLLDFGVASSIGQQHHTRTGVIKGKYGYLQPEVLDGRRPDRRADVWCLGVVTWELLTGVRLFERATEVETLQAIAGAPIDKPSKLRPGLPEEMDEIVMRALDRDPAARYPTAREYGRRLIRFLVDHRQAIGLPEVAELVAGLFPDGPDAVQKLLDAAEQLEPTPVVHDDIPIDEGSVVHERSTRAVRTLVPWPMAASAIGLLAALFLLILLVRAGGSESQAAPPAPAAPEPATAAVQPVAEPIERGPTTVNIVLFQFTPPAAEAPKQDKPRPRSQPAVKHEPPGLSQAIAPL